MTFFRIFLAVLFLTLSAYSAVTLSNHGLNLFAPFFGDMAEMGWPGQFNFDFMIMLALSGLWTAWRHQFSGKGVLLGLCAFFGGALFLSRLSVHHHRKNQRYARCPIGPRPGQNIVRGRSSR